MGNVWSFEILCLSLLQQMRVMFPNLKNTAMQKYHLVFANQAISDNSIYDCVRETKRYVFLKQPNSEYTFRVSKNTLNIKGIKEGENGFTYDVPTAIRLIKMKTVGDQIKFKHRFRNETEITIVSGTIIEVRPNSVDYVVSTEYGEISIGEWLIVE